MRVALRDLLTGESSKDSGNDDMVEEVEGGVCVLAFDGSLPLRPRRESDLTTETTKNACFFLFIRSDKS